MLIASLVHLKLQHLCNMGIHMHENGVSLHAQKHQSSLWHIDGYHKLIKWCVVIHGGIDTCRYSRLPVYLRASTNNIAATVLTCFLDAVRQYGLLSEFMLSHPERGPGRGSCITGRSVHNQRIERPWRDLFMGCISLFYHLFYTLEDSGWLDDANNVDLLALHYVFIPRINLQLDEFRQAYGHHRLRTARNQSPYQLWIRGFSQESGDDAALQGVVGDVLVRSIQTSN